MKVKELLSDESKWYKGNGGVIGKETDPETGLVTKRCIAVAMFEAGVPEEKCAEVREYLRENGYACLIDFNDNENTTYQQLMKIVDKFDL